MKYLKLFETFINIGELDLTQEQLNSILKGYIDAALWTEEDILKDQLTEIDFNEYDEDDDRDEIEKIIQLHNSLNRKPIDNFTREDIDNNSLFDAYDDIKKFIELAGKEPFEYALEELGLERIGHDIWLTRNRHGAGFFDHSFDDDIELSLMNAAQKLGEKSLYVGDDMRLYFT
jgi:hypothetical protein